MEDLDKTTLMSGILLKLSFLVLPILRDHGWHRLVLGDGGIGDDIDI